MNPRAEHSEFAHLNGDRAGEHTVWSCGRIAPALVVALALCTWPQAFAQPLAPGVSVAGQPAAPNAAEIARGRDLARIHCQSCHAFPEPGVLDRKTWVEQTLPRMRIRVGLSRVELDRHPEADLIKATKAIPEQPAISSNDFRQIFTYYAATAPITPLPQDPRAPIDVGLKYFRTEMAKYRTSAPASTMVRFNPGDRRIYVGNAGTRSLDIASPDGERLESILLDNIPVSMTDRADGLYLTLIGSFMPSEKLTGALSFLERTDKKLLPPKTILKGLPRPTDTQIADLNGDGKPDLVVSMFGNFAGRLSWHEAVDDGTYKEHILIDKAGAVRTVIHDFNNDGRPDIAVLMAQELESLIIFTNEGGGKFTPNAIFQQHPLYGHTGFELVDFNKDGRMDFLVTNGDNGEYPSPTKKYHGIRIYENKGPDRYEMTFFYPLNGAFKAVARDFDDDGDLDIAAISFFPDYEKSPEESFVFLENQGQNQFIAATFRECISGRWLTMDVADIDDDGDLDLILGSFIYGPSEVPEFLMNDWEKGGPPFVVLRNTSRQTRAGR